MPQDKHTLLNTLKWFSEMGADLFYNDDKVLNSRQVNRESETLEYNDDSDNADKPLSQRPTLTSTALPKTVQKATLFQSQSESCMTSIGRQLADSAQTLEELYNLIRNFEECTLKKAAQSTVIADGVISDILLIGEAPGANEDRYGIPFCGQSGKLLDAILHSIGLSRRKNCYITNTVFWRPPGNRRPTSEEISLCRPFVEKHIALLNPKAIILVGSTAVESILNLKHAMHSLRGQYFNYTNCYLQHSIKTAVILHPSYLLRQPLQKKNMWLDVVKIKKELL